MESSGLLSRQRSVDDERKVNIRLSQKGKELKTGAYDATPDIII